MKKFSNFQLGNLIAKTTETSIEKLIELELGSLHDRKYCKHMKVSSRMIVKCELIVIAYILAINLTVCFQVSLLSYRIAFLTVIF